MKKKKLFDNVFFIGLLSFFGGMSQDIFVPILPLYLANVLHMDKSIIGLSEGLVNSGASIFKIVAGYFTDRSETRKPIIFIGYFLSMIARPLLAIFTFTAGVLGLRFLDGIGKGVKDSPKDALIADSTKRENRGKGFGIARMLDTLGSVAGPILLFFLLYLLQKNELRYHIIFFISAIPLIVTLSVLSFFVQETPGRVVQKEKFSFRLPHKFYIFMAIVGFFTLGSSSDAFLILRAQNVGVGIVAIPLVYALFNFIYASASIPLGSLSDHIGRQKVILLGWLSYTLAYLGFGFASKPFHIWLLFAFYGLYYATTQGVVKAFVADLVPSEDRGKAYGIYNALIGIMVLPSSVIAGFLWDKVTPSAPFFFGSFIASIATLFLLVTLPLFKLQKV